MLTSVAVAQGNVITEGLNAWFDFGDTSCFLPTQGTGSITGGTIFNNLAPGQSAVSGTINGAVNWSTAFGGCLNISANTGVLQYTAGLSASFTVQTIVTPGTDANANNNWVNDGGGWPGFVPATDGFVWAQQFSSPNNSLLPILWNGASASAIGGLDQPQSGWQQYMRFPNVYTFATNGIAEHITYTNNILKSTNTSTRIRGNSAVGSIYLNFDPQLSNRKGLGRIVAYLHYNRQLSDQEIYQNAQFYLNRVGIK
jgi:hypothetical protein